MKMTTSITAAISIGNRILPALAFALLPTVCMAAWVIRNVDLMGLPFGLRPPPKFTWAENTVGAVATLIIWLTLIGAAWGIQRAFTLLSSWVTRRS